MWIDSIEEEDSWDPEFRIYPYQYDANDVGSSNLSLPIVVILDPDGKTAVCMSKADAVQLAHALIELAGEQA